MLQAKKYINEGYQHIVDIDLKSFFDEVEHYVLLQLLYRKVKCPITLRLIRLWLRAPMQIEGKLTKRRKGIPQEDRALKKSPVDIFSDEPACGGTQSATIQYHAT